MLRSVPFFIVVLACTLTANADFIISATNDTGYVRAAGAVENTTMIIGKSTGDVNYAGVAVFQLPTLAAGESVTGASLRFVTSNGGTITGANVDIWSLGIFSSVTLSTSMFIQSDSDGTAGRVKLANNFIPSGMLVSGGSVHETTPLQNSALATHIDALYDTDPTAGGKYLAIRLNPDASAAGISGSFRFHGGNATAANLPKLTLTTEVIAIPTPASFALLAPAALAWTRRRR